MRIGWPCWSDWPGTLPQSIGKGRVIVLGARTSSIIQHVGCINIFFLPIKDTRNYGAFELEHVRHFCDADTSQRVSMSTG